MKELSQEREHVQRITWKMISIRKKGDQAIRNTTKLETTFFIIFNTLVNGHLFWLEQYLILIKIFLITNY